MGLIQGKDVLPHLEENKGIEYINQVQLVERSSDPTDGDLVDGRIYHQTGVGLRVYEAGSWITLGASGGSISADGVYNNSAWTVAADANDVIFTFTTGFNMLLKAAATGTTDVLLELNDNTGGTVTDALLFTAANSIVDAIDASAANIDNAINIGGNAIAGTNFNVSAAGAIVGVGVDYGSGAFVGTGDIAINTDKFTVAASSGNTLVAGTLAVTGNTTLSGDLSVSGSFTFGGTLTVNETMTVDELILDTDGVAPGSGNCYVVRDNAGDLTLNAVSGKNIELAIAGTDEFSFDAAKLDMNANALDNCGFIILNAASAPANSEVYFVNDGGGDLTLNATSGQAVNIAIAGTDEFTFDAVSFSIASGNRIDFNAAQGSYATLLVDVNNNEILQTYGVASAVNQLGIKNASTGNGVTVETLGDDADIDLLLLAKGSGVVKADGVEVATISGAQTLADKTLTAPKIVTTGFIADADGDEYLVFIESGTPVNHFQITSADSGSSPIFAAVGTGTDIDLVLTSKGTGLVQITTNGLDMATNTIFGGTASGDDLLLASTEDATKGCVYTQALQEGLKIGTNTIRAGTAATNVLAILNGTAPQAGQTFTNGIEIYSAGGECSVMDSAGTATQLSPHNKKGDYVMNSYSVVKDITLQVNLELMLKELAVMFPKELSKFIKTFKGSKQFASGVKV